MTIKIEVMLQVSRTGPKGAEARGDVVKVTPGEAKRMLAAGQIGPLSKAATKALADFDKAEAAAAAKAKKPAKGAAETAQAVPPAAETATAQTAPEAAAPAEPSATDPARG